MRRYSRRREVVNYSPNEEMQQDQRAWIEAQQRMQQDIMERNQTAQKDMLDAVLNASRASVESPPLAVRERERVKPPRPTLQKHSRDDNTRYV